jgi:thiamine-monophosphate kinase
MAPDKRKRPGEFELIERYFRPLATDPGAYRLTDDAASYAPPAGEEVVLKADLIAEGVHFFSNDPPAAIAKKALRVNLSDLASKGAIPVGYLLSLALPEDWTESWIADFAGGLREDQERYGVTLFGGDTSRAAGGLTVSIAAIGRVPKGKMVLRSGAKPGDLLFVSGTIGDAALGLRLRLGTIDARILGDRATHLIDRYLLPEPRLALGPALRRYAASAMDISDGLVGDLAHICEHSGVTAEIEASLVPLSEPARALVAADPTALRSVLTGGDDYEVLASLPETAARAFSAEAAAAGVSVTRIGRIVGGEGPPLVRGRDGSVIELAALSHTHF